MFLLVTKEVMLKIAFKHVLVALETIYICTLLVRTKG